MKALRIIPFLILLRILSYGQSGQKSIQDFPSPTKLELTIDSGINEKEIYDFMKVVISDQNLNKDYGLSLKPQVSCDLSKSDKEFLTELLVDSIKEIKAYDSIDLENIPFNTNIGQLEKCLTQRDINFMLKQKIRISPFLWDNSRLGFNSSNDNNWYMFSIPIFSSDKTKVVIMIRSLCKGLCGVDRTILFKKEKRKWKSQEGPMYIH